MSREFKITDEYGRNTLIVGTKLVDATTDGEGKPHWLDVSIWKTESGRWVVLRQTMFRIRHLDHLCLRASRDSVRLRPARNTDTYGCKTCNPTSSLKGQEAWGQLEQSTLDTYTDPATLIASFETRSQLTGHSHHSMFARDLLAELSEQDEAVAAAWNEQVIA